MTAWAAADDMATPSRPVQGVVSGCLEPPAACRSDTSAQLVGHQRRMSKIKNKNIRLLCTVLLYHSMQDTCNSTESVCCDMMSLEDNGASLVRNYKEEYLLQI